MAIGGLDQVLEDGQVEERASVLKQQLCLNGQELWASPGGGSSWKAAPTRWDWNTQGLPSPDHLASVERTLNILLFIFFPTVNTGFSLLLFLLKRDSVLSRQLCANSLDPSLYSYSLPRRSSFHPLHHGGRGNVAGNLGPLSWGQADLASLGTGENDPSTSVK
jgi:hypothetical protein